MRLFFLLFAVYFVLVSGTTGCRSTSSTAQPKSRTLRFHDDSLSKQRANREIFTTASLRYSLRDYGSALAQLRALKLDAPDGAVELLYAKTYQSLVRLDSAELHARMATELLPENDEALLVLSQILISRQRFREAAICLQQAQSLNPRLSTLFSLAQCYEQLNDARAIGILRELSEQTDDLTVLFELAGIYERRGMSTEYVECMERIMNQFPAQSLPFQDYFESLLQTRKYQQALSLLENRTDFSAESKRDLRMRFAVRMYEDSAMAEATVLQRFVDLNIAVDSTNADVFELSGLLWLRSDDTVKALRDFLRCALLDSGSTAALRLSGYLVQQGKTSTAQNMLTQLSARLPQSAALAYYSGLTFSLTKASNTALRYLNRAIALDSTFEAAWLEAALMYDRLDAKAASDSCYERVLKINPNNAAAMNNLAYSYAERNVQLDRAEMLITDAMEIDSQNTNYLDTFGWVLYKKGDYQRAKEYLERAVRLSEPSSTLFEHLGDNYAKLGQRGSAVEAWKRALDLDSSKTYLRERLLNSK